MSSKLLSIQEETGSESHVVITTLHHNYTQILLLLKAELVSLKL